MVYRPTVRYPDVFKEYVDDLFRATTLDRNQIIRAALFAAAISPSFESILLKHKKKDVLFPSSPWLMDHHWVWMEQNPKRKGGKDVNVNNSRTKEIERQLNSNKEIGIQEHNRRGTKVKRREGQIPTERIRIANQGGIFIRIG
ncbi:hypothetical protein GJU41_19500 [Bacillus idriensis]|uniref:Uncharacterized protein n=1 Tax=Metabacillus idriensis TaxID=324768 RepID=A0A6I2MG60_9BACI|nr:hypothetical protein [Metabacillus idriensis]MRX56147.1 hypothetical protein [Metabacillus idriensis]